MCTMCTTIVCVSECMCVCVCAYNGVSECVCVCACVYSIEQCVCVSACVQTMVRFSITATTRGGATLLTHNCLEPPHCPEIFTILRKLLKFNSFATRVACVLCLSQALSVNFKESPDISKNPLNPQEAQILLDQKAQERTHMILNDRPGHKLFCCCAQEHWPSQNKCTRILNFQVEMIDPIW